MPDRGARARRPSVGLVVNPIAGLGGTVGLKGTDGAETVARARALGAEPQATHRAMAAVVAMREAWPAPRPLPMLSTGDGVLGAIAARNAGWPATVIGDVVREPTTPADTRRLAAALASSGVDLLLFAGGDGTARDIVAAIGDRTPALGIPAGVKIQSAVFALSPLAAGTIAAAHLSSAARRTTEREVLDLDEDAYRRGEVAPRLHGYLRVPADRLVQSRKAPSPAAEAAAMGAIAAEIVGAMAQGQRYVLGPGTTLRAVADALGVEKTLVGVDVVELTAEGPALVARDAGERDLRAALSSGSAKIVVTPIGGQGFLFGRGNQPISPAVIRLAGSDAIIVAATPAKLAGLGGRPLLVDTGDPELDGELAGHVPVVTGLRERMVVRVEAA